MPRELNKTAKKGLRAGHRVRVGPPYHHRQKVITGVIQSVPSYSRNNAIVQLDGNASTTWFHEERLELLPPDAPTEEVPK